MQENGEEANRIREDSKLEILAQVVSETTALALTEAAHVPIEIRILLVEALCTNKCLEETHRRTTVGRSLTRGTRSTMNTRKRLTQRCLAGHP